MKRRKLTRDERYATVVLMLKRGDGKPIVSLDEAREMSAREIIECFEKRIEWDHTTPHAIGGKTHPANMCALAKPDHKTKTKRDVKAIAKGKRLERREKAHREAMAGKLIGVDVRGDKADPYSMKAAMERLRSSGFVDMSTEGRIARVEKIRRACRGAAKRKLPSRPFPGSKKEREMRAKWNTRSR